MADGRRLKNEKSPYFSNGLTDCHLENQKRKIAIWTTV